MKKGNKKGSFASFQLNNQAPKSWEIKLKLY